MGDALPFCEMPANSDWTIMCPNDRYHNEKYDKHGNNTDDYINIYYNCLQKTIMQTYSIPYAHNIPIKLKQNSNETKTPTSTSSAKETQKTKHTYIHGANYYLESVECD